MAMIPNLDSFNKTRTELLKIQTANDETVLTSKNEAKEILREYIVEELNLFASDLAKQRQVETEERINFKLRQMENHLVNHIDEKINKITERIVSLIREKEVEAEIERRVDAKLQKIKNRL